MIHHIDENKCTGCGTCYKTCALDVFRIQTNQNNLAPCMATCPAGTDIRGYNALMQQGLLAEAAEKLKEKNPFPAITGRVCPHSCEKECHRSIIDTAVNINALEQYLGDLDLQEHPEKPAIQHVAKVAVIGSGPAGLSCAWFLAMRGYPVTVYEALPEPGGMLRYGIPAFRLPLAVVEAQVAQLEALGVHFECNIRVGEEGDLSVSNLKQRGFKAICLAPGTTKSNTLPLPGVHLPGVYHGVEFLRAVRSGNAPDFHGTVLVIGGGDVAMDAAISAQRLGASKTELFCLEDAASMPAFPHSIDDAMKAGVLIHPGYGPEAILGKERVSGLRIQRCTSVFDAKHNFAPVFDANDLQEYQAQAIILAIGQSTELEGFQQDIQVVKKRIVTDPLTYATSAWTIFAAGDAVSGPGSVIQAITGGREVALSIHRMLSGAHMHSEREELRTVAPLLPETGVLSAPRLERACVNAKGFEETRQGLDTIDALAESMRCMTCGAKASISYRDDCMTCFFCELRCPSNAIEVHPFKERLPFSLESQFGGF